MTTTIHLSVEFTAGHLMGRFKRITIKHRSLFHICFIISCSLSVGYYAGSTQATKPITATRSLSINVIDSTQPLGNNVTCLKTKTLLNLYSTTICVHQGEDSVSVGIGRKRIWEEEDVVRLLHILIQNPHLDVIDIGANIGAYTMFTAGALGRFTLAVDCFRPNIDRIVRAVQLEDVHNRAVIVHNALYSKSAEHIQLSSGYPAGLELLGENQSGTVSHFIVTTIRFDDLLPILVERGVRAAIIKIDIEGSEHYLVETGTEVFRQIDIQLVMMEWGHGFRKTHHKRYQSIVDHFTQLDYVTVDVQCQLLNEGDWRTTWPGNIYWIKKVNYKKNIC